MRSHFGPSETATRAASQSLNISIWCKMPGLATMVFSQSSLTMLVWLQVQFWMTSSSMTSEQDCEVDSAAYLQRNVKEAALDLVEKSNSCDPFQFGGGYCNDDGCNCFPPQDGAVVGPFNNVLADGVLSCVAQNSCRRQGDPNPLFAWRFNAAQPIVCSGQNSCRQNWVIENVGGACLDGDNAARDMTADMAGGAVAPSDVCCAQTPIGQGQGNNPTCKQSTFTNVEDLLCLGNNVCDQTYAEISGDFYCQAKQGCGHSNNQEKFVFQGNGAQHCVTCNSSVGSGFDQGSCQQANFEFDLNSRVEMLCDGFNACQAARVTVATGSCLSLTCNDGPTGGGGGNLQPGCDLMTVTLEGNAQCTCGGTAATNCPAGCVTDGSVTCSGLPTSCPGSFCCTPDVFAAASAASGSAFDCSGCTTTTTTGSSTSVTSVTSVTSSTSVTSVTSVTSSTSVTSTTSTFSSASDFEPSTSTAAMGGDPHLYTFDKQHYLLLQQGTFLLWRFSGLDAEISTPKLHKKRPVDFKIYAHYSGHTSYTKGLMLVDHSGAARRVLELTSEDCVWRTKGGTWWSPVDEPQLVSTRDADGDEMTAFKMTESKVADQKMHLHVELLMKEVNGFKKVAKLYTRCKPGFHINVKTSMSSKDDMKLVQGQLGVGGHTEAGEDSPSNFLGIQEKLRSDQEFLISQTWTELGGSQAGENYLNEVDEQGPAVLKACETPTDEDKLQSFESHLQDCVFDVCNGGGEVAAQLAAEIIKAE
eukprot:Skav211243  [mRNA]  locus=scaffold717:80340:82669:+ [translate_table: standard]